MVITRTRAAIAVLVLLVAAAAIVSIGVGNDVTVQRQADRETYLDAVNGDVRDFTGKHGIVLTFNDLGWTDMQLLTAGESVCRDTTPAQLMIENPGRLGNEGAQIIAGRARQYLC